MKKYSYIFIFAVGLLFAGCGADKNDPGTEYGPQMYHSVAYEPLSQITQEGIPSGPISSWYYKTNSMPFNDYYDRAKGQSTRNINMLNPVQGTVARQNFQYVKADSTLLIYELHKDSVEMAGKLLKNPLPVSDKIVEEGKHLYLGFCAPCHGEKGDGQGKVGNVYKGVPSYSTGRYATLPEGHIFHVITHGKGIMWAHKTQINPEERWKIVRYVQVLQKGGQQ